MLDAELKNTKAKFETTKKNLFKELYLIVFRGHDSNMLNEYLGYLFESIEQSHLIYVSK